MSIDAKKLDEAIALYERYSVGNADSTLLEAAKAYRATLPKEVEVEAWGILYPSGALSSLVHTSEEAAARGTNVGVPVRLTGRATLPPPSPSSETLTLKEVDHA